MTASRVGGNDIEIVSEWPHLGHIISSHCLDDADIFHRRNCMIGQANSVLCYFEKLSSSVKSMLTVVAFMDVSFGTCGISILTQFVLLGGKL